VNFGAPLGYIRGAFAFQENDMALSYKARKRLSLLILLVGMPIYVVIAVNLMDKIERLPIWAEVPAYVLLGFGWMLPFKKVFLGIGQADPNEPPQN
jgi:hypothetical protein